MDHFHHPLTFQDTKVNNSTLATLEMVKYNNYNNNLTCMFAYNPNLLSGIKIRRIMTNTWKCDNTFINQTHIFDLYMANYVLRKQPTNHMDIGLVCAPNVDKVLSPIINTLGWACVIT